jgi:hypothetical protein
MAAGLKTLSAGGDHCPRIRDMLQHFQAGDDIEGRLPFPEPLHGAVEIADLEAPIEGMKPSNGEGALSSVYPRDLCAMASHRLGN